MTVALIAVHVIVCVFLIFVVLLQSAQAADLAGAFGGGGSQTALGMRGATTLLQKATTISAVVFMLTSLALGSIDRDKSSSVIEGLEEPAATAPEQAGQPAAPEAQGKTPAAAQEQEQAGDQTQAPTSGQQEQAGSEQQ